MKRFILMFIACVMTFAAGESLAAEKKEIATVEFLSDIDCAGCVEKIMNFIPFQKGVKRVNVDLPTKRITISYDTAKSSEERLIELLEKIEVEAWVAVDGD